VNPASIQAKLAVGAVAMNRMAARSRRFYPVNQNASDEVQTEQQRLQDLAATSTDPLWIPPIEQLRKILVQSQFNGVKPDNEGFRGAARLDLAASQDIDQATTPFVDAAIASVLVRHRSRIRPGHRFLFPGVVQDGVPLRGLFFVSPIPLSRGPEPFHGWDNGARAMLPDGTDLARDYAGSLTMAKDRDQFRGELTDADGVYHGTEVRLAREAGRVALLSSLAFAHSETAIHPLREFLVFAGERQGTRDVLDADGNVIGMEAIRYVYRPDP
jgi:hypothetical protein